MDSKVSLSVLVPVYNEVYTIAECLKRVLAVKSEVISDMEIIVVNDGSTDGTDKILREFVIDYPQVILLEHKTNQGKGRAVCTALARATREISIIQDADLEYSPRDYEKLMIPFIKENADAVFGSRFLVGDYCRVLYFKHALVNSFLTFLTNLITDVNFSDIETCYKAVRTKLLQSIPLKSRGFDIEPELTIKLAKRKAVIFEVPISYAGRTKEEGKKIGWRDGLIALYTAVKYWLKDDSYHKEAYGAHILNSLSRAPKFSQWMAETIGPYVGERVLEIGAGMGNLTIYLLPRTRYVASDINLDYLDDLKKYRPYRPYLTVEHIDLRRREDFSAYEHQFDTVTCLNVLEHIEDDLAALKNMYLALRPGGRAIILVPHGQWLFSTLDEVLGHYRRYEDQELVEVMEKAGFKVEGMITSFNRIGVPAWILNGKLLHRKHFSSFQIRVLNVFNRLLRLVNKILPWHGLSSIVIGQRQ